MTQEWINQKNKEHEEKIAAIRCEVINLIQSLEKATDENKKALIEWIEKEEKSSYPMVSFGRWRLLEYYDFLNIDKNKFDNDVRMFEEYERLLRDRNMYNRYVDSEPMHFDGDVVITDPCYILKDGDSHIDDWEACDYGDNMEALGIKTYMTRDTLYGDWSCTTFNSDTKESIGSFCADAGLVSVFLLNEIMEYNPSFYASHFENRNWTATLIRDFKGEIQFVVEQETGTYEEDTKWWKAGDPWEEYVVRVIGHGINKVTGEPINFITSQTGL